MSRSKYRNAYDDDRHAKDDYDDYYEEDYDDSYDKGGKGGKGGKGKDDDYREVTLEITVDRKHHGMLIGERGANVRKMNQDFGVEVTIPRREENSNLIYIWGYVPDARRCKEHILSLVKQKDMELAPRTKTGVLAATKENEAAFPALPNHGLVALELYLQKASHGLFIGTGHERKEELLASLKGARRIPNIEIIIPKREDPSNIISIHVPEYHVDDAKKIIQQFLERYELVGATNRQPIKTVPLSGAADTKTTSTSKPEPAKPAPPAATTTPSTTNTSSSSTASKTTPQQTTTAPPTAVTKQGSSQSSSKSAFQIRETYFPVSAIVIPNVSVVVSMDVNGYVHEQKPKRAA